MTRLARLAVLCTLAAALGLPVEGRPADDPPQKLSPEQQEKLKYTVHLLQKLAAKRQGEGKLAQARGDIERAMAVQGLVYGDAHVEIARSLAWLARLSRDMDDFDAARSYAKRAVALREKLHGERHWQTTDARLLLADVEFRAGLTREKRADLRTADALVLEGQEFYNRGEYAKMQTAVEKTLALREAILGENHPETARSLHNLAMLREQQGHYAQAEALYLRAVAALKASLGERHPDYAGALNSLASCYESRGLYAKAEPLHRQALAIRKDVLGEKHPDYASSLYNLAGFYVMQGAYAKAEPLYRESLAISKAALGDKHRHVADGLNALGNLYLRQRLYAKAEPLLKEALAIRKEVLGAKHPAYASALHSLAELYKTQAQYAKAEPFYREALAVRKAALGERHPDYLRTLNNFAGFYQAQGQYAKAEPLAEAVLAARRATFGESHPEFASALNNLAVLYAPRWPDRARALSLRAMGIMADHLERSAAAQAEGVQLAHAAAARVYLANLLDYAAADPAAVYAAAFRWRGSVTTRQAFARAARAANSDPAVRGEVEQLRAVTGDLSNLVNSPSAGANLPARLKELEDRREQLETRLAAGSQEFARYRAALALTPADLQKCLPAGAALVDFLAHGDRVAAFVVTRDAITRVELAGGRELAEMVADFTAESSLLRQRPVQGAGDAGKLHKAVWEPLQPHLQGATLVLVCPDGPLCRLPFAALRGSDPKKYLIEEVAVAVVPVPRMLPDLLAAPAAKPAAPGASLLAVGDVDFGADPAAGKLPGERLPPTPTRGGGPASWKPLPGTRAEVEAIGKLFAGAVPGGTFKSLTRGGATEAAVRRLAGDYRYLHLATHGFFADPARDAKPESKGFESADRRAAAPDPALLCGVVCAGANRPTPDADGVLTALEVAEMDLRRTDLAVLSACETGLGEVAGGEGVLGLQRAFQLAGARATVASLWRVPDAATAALAGRFYENRLTRGMPALAALREAQLWLLNERVVQDGNELVKIEGSASRRTPPLFWAAFALSGDWR